MRAECIECLIDCNREVEFTYLDELYSITYYNDNRVNYISVAGPGKVIDVKNAYEVLNLQIGNKTLEEIFSELPDSAFDIY